MIVSVDVPDELLQAAQAKLRRQDRTIEEFLSQAVEEYVNFPPPDEEDDEKFRQVIQAAREGMARYHRTLRELAK